MLIKESLTLIGAWVPVGMGCDGQSRHPREPSRVAAKGAAFYGVARRMKECHSTV